MDDKLLTEFQSTSTEIAKVEQSISEQVAEFQTKLATLRQKDTELRAKIKEAMEANNVKKFENEFVSLTYVAPTTRKTFDSKKFQEVEPEIYNKYLKESKVSSSLRLKIK
jgi:regulator of replication initiation timing